MQPPTSGLSQREQAVQRAVEARRAALLEDLRLHVGIPTGGRHRAGLDETRERLCARLRALGAEVELVAGQPAPTWIHGLPANASAPPVAVCRRLRRTDSCRLLLSGHLDTVHDPAGSFRDLKVEPDGKRATGPGCVDMKGGLVIAVAALEALEEAGVDLSWTFILNSDEETGSYHSDAALRAAAREHDVGLVFEPALPDGGLVVQRPGSGQFLLECRGRAAHVGRDFAAGISAVNALAHCLLAIPSMADPARGVIASIGPLDGGIAPNVVPDRARAWGNARFADERLGAELETRLRALATAPGVLPGVSVHTSFNRPAKPLMPRTERLAMMARGVSELLGHALPFGATGGVCDGNNLQAAGLPTIDTLGVRGGGLHTPDEWIALPSLVERCTLIAVLCDRLGSMSRRDWAANDSAGDRP